MEILFKLQRLISFGIATILLVLKKLLYKVDTYDQETGIPQIQDFFRTRNNIFKTSNDRNFIKAYQKI